MPAPPLNIVYLHCHDAGRYIQPYGYPVATPSLQRFAEQGVLFRQAFTTSPTCSPSRACLLTGQHAHTNGMTGLAHRGFELNDYRKHLIHLLHDAGYTSALAGIQHIAQGGPTGDMTVDAIGYKQVLTEDGGFEKPTQAAIDYLHRPHEKPFFLSVGYFAPHRGNVAHRPAQSFPALGPAADERYVRPAPPFPDTPQTRRDMAEYLASMQSTDLCMGRVLEALDRTGLADRTLVIITTDHGIAFPNMKSRLTDHGMGVMLMMRGPASSSISGGQVIDSMVTHLDVFPTVCELLDLEPRHELHGRSLLPLVSGQSDHLHDAVFAETNFHAAEEQMRAVRTDRFKYIRHYSGFQYPVLPNCDDSITKQMRFEKGWSRQPQPKEELFDLIFDPQEANNLADRPGYDTVLSEMRQRLDDWMKQTDDPLQYNAISPPLPNLITPSDAYSPDGSPPPSDTAINSPNVGR